MAPFLIPPLIKAALGVAAAGAVVTWMVREVRRINEEIERSRMVKIAEPVRKDSMPTLRRDPRTGEYRVM